MRRQTAFRELPSSYKSKRCEQIASGSSLALDFVIRIETQLRRELSLADRKDVPARLYEWRHDISRPEVVQAVDFEVRSTGLQVPLFEIVIPCEGQVDFIVVSRVELGLSSERAPDIQREVVGVQRQIRLNDDLVAQPESVRENVVRPDIHRELGADLQIILLLLGLRREAEEGERSEKKQSSTQHARSSIC